MRVDPALRTSHGARDQAGAGSSRHPRAPRVTRRRSLVGRVQRPFPQPRYPIVGAPLAGGPSTPALTAAVSNAGGLGLLAAGYLSADALKAQIDETRSLTDAPFGVNIFCIGQ